MRTRLADLGAEAEAARVCLRSGAGPVHLLGIAGVGMAGVAVQLAGRGFEVSGCDTAKGSVADWLVGRGIAVAQGHDPAHVTGRERFIIRSPAVSCYEPELERARALGIPLFVRGTVLAAMLNGQRAIAVGGTHGKTTTTAMIVHTLRALGADPSFCIGGEADALGGVAGVGQGGLLVVEADESDGTLALYRPDHAVITNVELDHVDFFRDAADVDACFAQFAAQAGRCVVYCADDAGAARAASGARRSLGYGCGARAWLRAVNIRLGAREAACEVVCDGRALGELSLGVTGQANLLNALAAAAVALDLGHAFPRIAAALRGFRSVRRRFDLVAEARGILVIEDYAHHPTEIRALLEQVRALRPRRVLVVFQPHRYSRTAALGPQFPPSFEGVDEVVLAPVYAASEQPVAGGETMDLHAHFVRHGRVPSRTVHSLLEAWEHIRNKWREGDVILVVGAGDVDRIAGWAARELASSTHTIG